MPPNPAWKRAFGAALTFRSDRRKASELIQGWRDLESADHRRAQRLFLSWLRQRGLAAEALRPFLRRAPRPAVQALLEMALAESAIADTEAGPVIVHHAVEAAKHLLSAPESRLVNAVLRRALPRLPEVDPRHSHPDWLMRRWETVFGTDATRELIVWNQQEAPTWVRWATGNPPTELGLERSPWTGFFRVEGAQMAAVLEAVDRGEAYIQDPFTRHPVELALAHRPRTVLDLCAAPGGKTRALLDAIGTEGARPQIVAVDLPGRRLERLRENLATTPAGQAVTVFGHDVAHLTPEALRSAGLPAEFDAVVLDVPCSNTGVIGRRPDVRWLLEPSQIEELIPLQARLLDAAADLVAPGGTLVYSTCSLEPEENADQIRAFTERRKDFVAGEPRLSLPWRERHDGGGAFPLTRQSPGK